MCIFTLVMNELDKKKGIIAPRSGMQFKIGPTFEKTILTLPIFASSNNKLVFPKILARIDRGFDLDKDTWIGYKRNYFTVVAAFGFESQQHDYVSREKFYTVDKKDQPININHFAIKIAAICCDSMVDISLIQHTAKRDRGPQSAPPLVTMVPGDLPGHEVIKKSSNIRNKNKIDLVEKLFLKHLSEYKRIKPDSILHTYPTITPSKVARYERVQFTSNMKYQKVPILVNCERYYRLEVHLVGVNGLNNHVLAKVQSLPVIIRGRSPSNYSRVSESPVYKPEPLITIGNRKVENITNTHHKTSKVMRLKLTPTYTKPIPPTEQPSSSGQTDTIEESDIFDTNNFNLVDSESYNDENSSMVRPPSFDPFQSGPEISQSFDVDLFNCNQMFPLQTEYLLDRFEEQIDRPVPQFEKLAAKKLKVEKKNRNLYQIDESVSSFQKVLERIGKELLR